MRDDPYDPGGQFGFGQDVIDSILASASFAGTSPCAGAVTVRLAPTAPAAGETASLTPEELFPAESHFDVVLEVQGAFGLLEAAGSVHLATTINALPPDPGEVYGGSGLPVDLLNPASAPVGEITALSQRIVGAPACPSGGSAHIDFPSHGELHLALPGGSASVVFDVVRGGLSDLLTTGGDFGSATCVAVDTGATLLDASTPTAGAGFYYLAREGFGAFEGTWNGTGTTQAADRDATVPPCP